MCALRARPCLRPPRAATWSSQAQPPSSIPRRPLTTASSPRWNQATAAAQTAVPAVAPTTPIVVGRPPTPRRPVGGLRGAVAGFGLGLGAASAYGYYYVLNDYNASNRLLLDSVEELQASTHKITTSFTRLSQLERDLRALSTSASSKAEAERSASRLTSTVEGLHEEVLALKERVVGVEQDVNKALRVQDAPSSKHLV